VTNPNQQDWSAEEITQLVRMWVRENEKASVIAATLGRTRNAVIGKVSRLGLTREPGKQRALRNMWREVRKEERPTLVNSNYWTEDQTNHLLRLWNTADATAQTIGAAIGKSKEAVRKKAARLGLSVSVKAPSPPLVEAAKVLSEPEVNDGVWRPTFFELENHHCRWPLGGPTEPAKFFCGAPRLVGRSYCLVHYEIAWRHAPKPLGKPPLILQIPRRRT
jgi:GcrA cell cycle regulator